MSRHLAAFRRRHLLPGENVVAHGRGGTGFALLPGSIVLTDRRVVFVRYGLPWRRFVEVPLTSVTGVGASQWWGRRQMAVLTEWGSTVFHFSPGEAMFAEHLRLALTAQAEAFAEGAKWPASDRPATRPKVTATDFKPHRSVFPPGVELSLAAPAVGPAAAVQERTTAAPLGVSVPDVFSHYSPTLGPLPPRSEAPRALQDDADAVDLAWAEVGEDVERALKTVAASDRVGRDRPRFGSTAFPVRGNEGDYVVTFTYEPTGVATLVCSCPAGQFRQLCHHRVSLLQGDVTHYLGEDHEALAAAIAALRASWAGRLADQVGPDGRGRYLPSRQLRDAKDELARVLTEGVQLSKRHGAD